MAEKQNGRASSNKNLLSSNRAFSQLLYDLTYIRALSDAVRRELAAELDLTAPQFNVLLVIAERTAREGISVTDIADYLHVTGPFVTHECNKLELMKMVVKTSNPDDGRSILLKLSAEGENKLRGISDKMQSCADWFLDGVTREELRKLKMTLGKLIRGGQEAMVEITRPRKAQRFWRNG
ncbi:MULTISPECIES: MarR family winged helix-turn-helix transcriptional regulator [unclassified Bradyrhizobium]|uniref:MarR family winged helix-turn-helix transcriptional regulator n=1 Tax=unclassified Bradyrhizobium TaxID=2631580 RepID=UPI00143CCACB|nr:MULTISPECIES: MarR family transcriptional regulator [unclassified Bradyrhizobium]